MPVTRKTTSLSKSRFISGLQCLKRLYWQCYNRELAAEKDEKTQIILDQGTEVGILATKAFPGGVLVKENHTQHEQAIDRTRELMADKDIPAIFEAAFTYEDIGVRVDILERLPRNHWRLIEVKSTTRVKDYHTPDVAIQKYVLEGCGLTVSGSCLMHLNREYVYEGGEYDIDQLFTIEDLENEIQCVSEDIPKLLGQQRQALACKTPPDIKPGEQCTHPFQCEFYEQCNKPVADDWVGNLPGMGGKKLNAMLELGIESIHDIPDDYPLSERQQYACTSVQMGRPYFDEELKDALDELEHPLYYMDFETYFPALPRYSGMRPYGQIPFQWSVHVLKKPKAKLEHYEFLSDDGSDPQEGFLTSLLDALGDRGHILVYNQAFESKRLDELSARFPEYMEKVAQVQARLWDLLPVVRQHVYHPDFGGSYSLKSVLPALVPGMSYENMAVADGEDAGTAYAALIGGNLKANEHKKLRKALLKYCEQDTLAMVKLVEELARRSWTSLTREQE